jgi:type II secretory ATPase GspE/PulE/Tfp pilus assembly ATPase PilB-like protein
VAGASLDSLRSLVRARDVKSLAYDGWQAVRDGRTTIAEVTRVVSEDDGR